MRGGRPEQQAAPPVCACVALSAVALPNWLGWCPGNVPPLSQWNCTPWSQARCPIANGRGTDTFRQGGALLQGKQSPRLLDAQGAIWSRLRGKKERGQPSLARARVPLGSSGQRSVVFTLPSHDESS